jgi:hypothetical protein
MSEPLTLYFLIPECEYMRTITVLTPNNHFLTASRFLSIPNTPSWKGAGFEDFIAGPWNSDGLGVPD